MAQAKDGTLLIASGEVASGGPNPQSMTDPRGKILRIAADGSIPKDNPFVKTAGANPALYALGFRDIQAADVNPATGELWVGENEPMGGDELNRIKSGGNYGFPVISYGRENGGGLINGGKTAEAGMEQPVYSGRRPSRPRGWPSTPARSSPPGRATCWWAPCPGVSSSGCR
jgi:glucose/arabinose dehydrogenase